MAPRHTPAPKRGQLSHWLYLYNLWTGLYMLDLWEQRVFSACRGVARV